MEPETHCCAASVKNISVGYHDLDSLIQTPPSRLTFRLELLEMHREGSFHKESWTLSDEEKLDRVRKLKEEGNALFKRKSVREAMEKYSEAVALLDQLILKEKPGSQAHVSLNGSSFVTKLFSLFLNMGGKSSTRRLRFFNVYLPIARISIFTIRRI